MATKRDLFTAATLILATAALILSLVSLTQPRIPGPQGPPGETVYLPSWPPPPCEPNCSWHPVRTFTQGGGTSDNVNITGSEVRAAWSVVSGAACDASLSITFRHLDGPDAGTDLLFPLLVAQPGAHSDTYDFPSGSSSGAVTVGAYAITVAPSNSCGGGWNWSVAVQEWR